MSEAGQKNPGTMGALIGMTPEDVQKLCNDFSNKGILQPANFNSPGQIAISGNTEIVRKALEEAKNRGAKRAVELVVSGAFHSPLMEHARKGLSDAIMSSKINDVTIDFFSNVTANKVSNSSDIKNLLLQQLTSPVLWQDIMQNMIADGYNSFYEIGPGSVLKGLLKRIDRTIECEAIGTLESVNKLREK
jgi:[acyl-carrier-protein] S-malonyltransferase